MKATQYLNETVIYGGLPCTRGAMIRDLEKTARRLTDDPARQKMIVARYMQGFERRC